MTVQQIAEWVEAYNDSTLARVRETVQLLDGQAKQIISGIGGMFNKKIRYLEAKRLYPELFGEKPVDTSDLTPEQIAKRQALAWRAFLGV